MASILQLLFTISQIAERYLYGASTITPTTPGNDPSEDLLDMMAKVADGLFSDNYAQPVSIYEPLDDTAKKREISTKVSPKQQQTDDVCAAVRPYMFKRLVGKNHFEFGCRRQRDASVFFQFMLEKLVAAEYRGAKDRFMQDGESENDFLSTGSLFSFEVEERTSASNRASSGM